MSKLEDALADYVTILVASADHTNRAEDRVTYTNHLADSARMFAAIHNGELSAIREEVASARRRYGWGYLSGDAGAAAESAFDRFAKLVESTESAT